MIQYQTISVGENRGRPRIYLQGRQLEEAGFKVDERFNLEMFDGYLVIKRHSEGERKVSGKNKRTVPVIDINTERLLGALGTSEKVTLRYGSEIIVISTERTERQRRSRRPEATEAALFAGGGLLSLAAHQAGFKTVWANEVDRSRHQLAGAYSDQSQARRDPAQARRSGVRVVYPRDEVVALRPLGEADGQRQRLCAARPD